MNAITSQTHALSINPASGETVGSYPYETAPQLDAALDRATRAFRTWRRQPVGQRAELLLALATALREQAEAMAQMITLEMGKPIAQARAEIEKCAQLSEWYAAHGPAMLAVELPGLAGAARCRADFARWQYLRAQARAECDGLRVPDQSSVPASRFP
jgi:succinate-semialdehyde dehydrogenase